MTIKVLIVDDSTFICKVIKRILEDDPEFIIVGFAKHGQEAIIKNAALKPDVITMDVEMPVMDGITAVKRIMAERPTPILMFSSMTQVGAKATLEALNAGAVDFLAKQFEDSEGHLETIKQQLRQRVRMVAAATVTTMPQRSFTGVDSLAKHPPVNNLALRDYQSGKISAAGLKPAVNRYQEGALPLSRIKLLVIVASTGGPVAMQKILMQLPVDCAMPILLVQHMPASFTRSFAERLNSVCAIRVKEAAQDDVFEAGQALLAPGGMQLEISANAGRYQVKLHAKTVSDIYAPCADITLASVAQHFPGQSLTVVLTGMGADGRDGAVKLKQGGALVWAQDEASCTIYGMPKAIIDAGLADKIYDLDAIAAAFKRISG